MDPLGFGLENFDAIGRLADQRRRATDRFVGPAAGRVRLFAGRPSSRPAFCQRREAFARCLAEKMLTYALGRGLDRADRRAVDQIVATLARNEYRFSALILAVVESEPFLNRRAQRGNR